MDIVIGTAGHIDHGKTSLVKALTGVDADRLPEEKQRGITIDLGFAELELDGSHASFVDVPGHERFVKNMLAGASGIDIVMLVVAADEGVMPQTREHFDICRLLDIRNGIVVVTKCDAVDKETLEIVGIEIRELTAGSFLADSPVVRVSSKTGEGIDELKNALAPAARKIPKRRSDAAAFLPIDRSFAVKGFGTVVTGTLASGELRAGSELELLPAGRNVRVRGLQSHGQSAETAASGRRVAVNLGGIDHAEVARGDVLSEGGVLRPTQIINVQADLLERATRPLRSRQRVRVHIGTSEVLARVRVLNEIDEIDPGSRDLVQLRLEAPVAARMGDRFVIRSYSPQITIGGGRVVDPTAEKFRKKDLCRTRVLLTALAGSAMSNERIVTLLIESAGNHGITHRDLNAKIGWRRQVMEDALTAAANSGKISNAGGIFLSTAAIEQFKSRITEMVAEHHRREPLSKGIAKEALRVKGVAEPVFAAAIAALLSETKIRVDGDTVSAAERRTELTAEESIVSSRIVAMLTEAGVQVPKLDEVLAESIRGTKIADPHARKLLKLLLDSGDVVKATDEFAFARSVVEGLVLKLRDHAANGDRTIDVPMFKEFAGVSRKYAIPLLEYFDREKITIRTGDKRVIR